MNVFSADKYKIGFKLIRIGLKCNIPPHNIINAMLAGNAYSCYA